jgi:DNA-binding NtrC family response regulator
VPARILIVDDEPDIRDVLREHLATEGYVVDTRTTGAAAIAAIREERFDAVLLDLNMPGAIDGRAVLSAISRAVPVIVITAIDDLADARATLQAGAFDFVSKPFDLHRISELVATAVVFRRRP